ncbi:hypothetical protein PHLCEN_2v2268 [Hermanssonia centrifuga]|uniref:Fungal-type protein kinase domain-containing protein n=1 Tax=Hermanssonia centrifuga TaxID=98765 RepID=A0A2R6RPL7_9APHY|nr:hypothetical protein PHLCEN_2v2268 [Hermanssonia centrifuga]
MPPVDLKLVKDVVESLRSGQNPVIVGERWADFQVDPNKFEADREDVVFRPLIDIMKAVANAATVALGGNKLRCTYESNPNAVPASESRDNLTRPDGWIIRMGSKSSGKESHWMDMAATGEFKKEDLEPKVTDNNNEMLWSLQHCMVDDARRRFAFGFTIENTSMRLWWCNRELVVVSNPFNFVLDHLNFVRFILGMLFSSETELGWDPTMTL